MSAVVVPTLVVRDIAVTSGASEFVWVQLTELAGIDITGDTFSLALVPAGQTPEPGDFDWPSDTEHLRPDVIRLAMLIDSATVPTLGDHTVWARVVDVSETLIFPASGTVQLS